MRAGKWALVAIIAVVVLVVGGGILWYASVPHTPEAQFAYAETLEKKLKGDAATRNITELTLEMNDTVEQYRRVGTRFGKNPKAAEGLKRIAEIQLKIAKDPAKALATYDELIKEYPEEENAGFALRQQAAILKEQADAMKAQRAEGWQQKYQDALAKLDEYRKQFEKGKDAAEALLEIGRIWQDGLEEPLIRQFETFEKVIKDYPRSEQEPEALLRLAKAYEKAKEYERALALFGQLVENYPKSKFAAEATYARGKLLAEKMEKHDEAAKEFEKVTREYPESGFAGPAGSEAAREKGKAATEEGDKVRRARYGGTVPYDTGMDRLPPAELYKQFTAQKLDAEAYDLKVDFTPAEHAMKVEGTLKLTNRGDDKKRMLFLLGPGFEISTLTVNGGAAQHKHTGETLEVTLPAELKSGAAATLAFAYTGKYADSKEVMKMRTPGPGGGTKGARTGGAAGSGASTAPSTRPGRAGEGEVRPAPTGAQAKTDVPVLAGKEPGPGDPFLDGPATRPSETLDPQIGLGEYGYALSGANWYPVTIVGDIFDAHLVLHTPANTEAVATGGYVRREPSKAAGTPGTFEFQTKVPVFGLYFAYGPYVVQEKAFGDMRMLTYLRPANASKHEKYVEVTHKILSFYAEKFAPFPYEKMAVVDVPLPPFLGGVGPASLMFLQETMVDHPEVPETLLAHELAHQWWGNLIPINMTDAGYSQWLSEGFATYSDALYTEHTEGQKAFARHMERYQQLYYQTSMSMPGGVKSIKRTMSPADAMYRPIVYEKGAYVLHMLRKVMGDEKFFKLMRLYVESYKNKLTVVDDFRRLATQVQGEDLSWFFAQWFDNSVSVHWKVTAAVAPGSTGGGANTKVTILQPDDFVKMPADVTLIGAKDERQVVKDVMIDKKESTLEAATPFVPVRVIVDEENWVLKRPGVDNIWSAEKGAASP
jgi:TolA-binding protein